MKRVLFAGVALGVAVTSQAQSSVTLYGIADAGFAYTSNAKGGRQFSLNSGNENSSRWGVKGLEDLGGGLQAIFTLEAGANINSGTMGQNGTEFGRQAFVGLSSHYGTVTLGRQYATLTDVVGPLSAGGSWAGPGAGYGAHPADADNLDAVNRINNAIIYQSPDYHGLTFGGLYSLGGKPGDFSRNQIFDLSAAYNNGPVKLGVGYLVAKDPNYSFWGDKANDSTTGSNIASPVVAGYASAGSQQIVAVGGSYQLDRATLGVVYSNTRFINLGAVDVAGLNATESGYRGSVSLNTGEANIKYQASRSLMLGAAYSYTRNSGAGSARGATYQQVDFGAIYALSKRTSWYALGVYQIASGVDSTGQPAVAAITGTTASSSNRQTLITAGLTHKF